MPALIFCLLLFQLPILYLPFMNASLNSAFFKQILESIEDYAVFTSDVEGRITSWNTGAEHVLGYTEEEIIGQSADIIFTPEDIKNGAPQREAAEALAKGRGIDERYHQRKDGTLFWGSGLVFPLRTLVLLRSCAIFLTVKRQKIKCWKPVNMLKAL
jgi:PAS domain S-box-containing protein